MPLDLSSPLTLNPAQATKLVVKSIAIQFESVEGLSADGSISVYAVLQESGGAQIGDKTISIDGPAVQTWLRTRRSDATTFVMAKLGVAGTVS